MKFKSLLATAVGLAAIASALPVEAQDVVMRRPIPGYNGADPGPQVPVDPTDPEEEDPVDPTEPEEPAGNYQKVARTAFVMPTSYPFPNGAVPVNTEQSYDCVDQETGNTVQLSNCANLPNPAGMGTFQISAQGRGAARQMAIDFNALRAVSPYIEQSSVCGPGIKATINGESWDVVCGLANLIGPLAHYYTRLDPTAQESPRNSFKFMVPTFASTSVCINTDTGAEHSYAECNGAPVIGPRPGEFIEIPAAYSENLRTYAIDMDDLNAVHPYWDTTYICAPGKASNNNIVVGDNRNGTAPRWKFRCGIDEAREHYIRYTPKLSVPQNAYPLSNNSLILEGIGIGCLDTDFNPPQTAADSTKCTHYPAPAGFGPFAVPASVNQPLKTVTISRSAILAIAPDVDQTGDYNSVNAICNYNNLQMRHTNGYIENGWKVRCDP